MRLHFWDEWWMTMARSGLRTNPKFRRLVRTLNIPSPYVTGLLETLWHVGYDQGDDLIGDGDDVELAAEWPGKRGILFEALAQAGFIEQRADRGGRWAIHDLFDNAPDYVKKRMSRRIDNGLGDKTADNGCQTADNGRQTADNGRHDGGQWTPPNPPNPPSPTLSSESNTSAGAVSPTVPEPEKPKTGKRRNTATLSPACQEFWDALPPMARDRSSRPEVAEQWQRQGCEPVAAEVMAGLARWIASEAWVKNGGEFIKGAHRWLNKRLWTEHPAPAGSRPTNSQPDPNAPNKTDLAVAAANARMMRIP